MKLRHLAVVGALVLVGVAQAEDSAMAKACKADIQHFCSGKTTIQELSQCLLANKDKMSPNCKDALSKAQNPPKS